MADTMRHRGPDDSGVETFGRAGFGFRRLSIIDLEGSHQPLANEDKSVRLVCNGEIYNYLDLRDQLEQRGHRFSTRGDAEVVVHAYEEWGDDCVSHLRGMFALAVWDKRRERLLLARDRLGIKPLYYGSRDGCLVFGSELRTVMASEMVSRDMDRHALDLYLALMVVPEPRTIYADVRKLPPGTILTWSAGNTRTERYWHPPRPSAPVDVDEAAQRLREHLNESVRLHLQSDVPLGFFLSGGLDSSTLVALAAELGHTPRTFSVGFETQSHNELVYARQIADRYGCDHNELEVRADAAAVLPAIVAHFGEPFADSSAIPTYYICRAAADHATVVVGGDGGDELFIGYEWTRRHRLIQRWQRLPRATRRAAAGLTATARERAGVAGGVARFLSDGASTALEGYRRRISCMTLPMREALYTPRMHADVGEDATDELLAPFFAEQEDAVTAMNRADLGVYLPADDLCKVDRMTMMHSLEGRVPLLDHKVAEFALGLPTETKLHGTTSKYILKRAVADLLPPALLKQRKQGFAVPVAKWMRDELHNDARRILLSQRAADRGLFREEVVCRWLDDHRAGKSNHGHRLWTLMVLEIWFRLNADGTGRMEPPGTLADLGS